MKRLLLTLCLFAGLAPLSLSQDEETINKLFQDAIEAMGGEAYLNVADMVSTGQYFLFDQEGRNSPMIRFTDYTKLPDKSRFESGNRKKELDIEVFNLEKNEGWILEGQKPVREAKPDEMKGFKEAVKHALDNIIRFRYKDPENKLFYLGPGEGHDVTLEVVKIVDPENDETIVYFDRISKLPARVEYRAVDSRGVRRRFVVEFSQWHVIQGVKTPLRVDVFVNGRRYRQIFTNQITYNNNLQDSFFSKPLPAK
ncbi:MAG: hypothetical protein GXX84_13400 [Acidobacteria bacterium]|nr:hypothetical protein [Acidobacteriota bacterium]